MGPGHSIPGAYIPVPGGSAVVLKGFVKKIESQKEFRISEGVRKRTRTEISDPAKIPIQAEIGIWILEEDLVDTPRYSVWSLRMLRLYQPTADRL